MNRPEFTELVVKYVDRLKAGLSQQDRRDGWTEESLVVMIRFFENMADEARCGKPVNKPEYRTVARGMDHWGIYQGDLLEQAAEISAVIMEGVR